jgi:signal transduction histidine kinase
VTGGLLAIALLVIGGSYLIGRAVARELAVARVQSDFVAAVSHEFRTPLTVLRQLSELLARGRVPSEEMRQRYYGVLEQESSRLHRLVEGLLKFGRMEAGLANYQFETIDIAAFLRSLVDEFGIEAGRRGCRVELKMDASMAAARADREALGCVVWNLLDNAVKYSPDCRTVWVDLAREDGCVAIRVRDQGVGIRPEERQRVFQKFVRGAAAQTLGVQGTGIGLAVGRQIVERHGGRIRLDSEPGKGSTFTVLLPAAGAAPA